MNGITHVPVGRFAPSPTGRMHLGNLLTALVSWLSVRSRGGRWILRIEDLDPQRSKPEYARQIEEDLLWLGLDWDEGGLADRGEAGPYSQSRRGDLYEAALGRLRDAGLVYPCRCTVCSDMSLRSMCICRSCAMPRVSGSRSVIRRWLSTLSAAATRRAR